MEMPSTGNSQPSIDIPSTENLQPSMEMDSTENSQPSMEMRSTENSLPSIDIRIPSTENSLPCMEIPIPSTESSLPSVEIPIPSIETSQPSMEIPMPPTENSQPSMDSKLPDGVVDNACKESKHEVAEQEVRSILAVIASTGKFWHDWDKLKSMLSFQLKQVMSGYPEAKMESERQIASLGETYPDLVKRLDEAFYSFTEGPPFTLQRLCEILLEAQRIYPKLSKLALALEKNLLVTSMMTVSTDPYPQVVEQNSAESYKSTEEPKLHSDSVQNGVEPAVGDRDEVMTEVEQADIDDDMTIAMEAFEDIVGPSETSSVQPNNS